MKSLKIGELEAKIPLIQGGMGVGNKSFRTCRGSGA